MGNNALFSTTQVPSSNTEDWAAFGLFCPKTDDETIIQKEKSIRNCFITFAGILTVKILIF
jgi:hypothetical protein